DDVTPTEFLELSLFGVGVLDIALLIIAATMLPALWRVVAGPRDADRAVAADHVFYVLVATVALLALRTDRAMLLDLVVVCTLIGFISAVVLARYVGRQRS